MRCFKMKAAKWCIAAAAAFAIGVLTFRPGWAQQADEPFGARQNPPGASATDQATVVTPGPQTDVPADLSDPQIRSQMSPLRDDFEGRGRDDGGRYEVRGRERGGREPERGVATPPDERFRRAQDQIRRATAALRGAENDQQKADATKRLNDLLNEYFDEDVKHREGELTRLEERVKNLRAQLDRRRQKKQEIIDLQIKVAANEADGLGMFSQPGPNPPGNPAVVRDWYGRAVSQEEIQAGGVRDWNGRMIPPGGDPDARPVGTPESFNRQVPPPPGAPGTPERERRGRPNPPGNRGPNAGGNPRGPQRPAALDDLFGPANPSPPR